jgi:hypothetical protein
MLAVFGPLPIADAERANFRGIPSFLPFHSTVHFSIPNFPHLKQIPHQENKDSIHLTIILAPR